MPSNRRVEKCRLLRYTPVKPNKGTCISRVKCPIHTLGVFLGSYYVLRKIITVEHLNWMNRRRVIAVCASKNHQGYPTQCRRPRRCNYLVIYDSY